MTWLARYAGEKRIPSSIMHRRNARRGCYSTEFFASPRLQIRHSAQVHCHADQLPFSSRLVQAAKTELTKSEHRFNPTVGRFDDCLAPTVSGFRLLVLQALCHGCAMRILVGIDSDLRASLATEGNDDLTGHRGQLFEAHLSAESGVRQRLLWQVAGIGLDCLEQGRQPIVV